MNRAGHFYYIPTQTKVKQATFDPIFDDESATFEIPMKDVQVVEEMKGDKHILRAEVYDPATKQWAAAPPMGTARTPSLRTGTVTQTTPLMRRSGGTCFRQSMMHDG